MDGQTDVQSVGYLRVFSVLLKDAVLFEFMYRQWRMNKYGSVVEWYWQVEVQVAGEKPCHSASFYTINPTLIGLESNPGLGGERAVISAFGMARPCLSVVVLFCSTCSVYVKSDTCYAHVGGVLRAVPVEPRLPKLVH